MPAIYESKSTILIEDQQIPEDFVRSTVTGFADERIQSLTQQILSRSKLWEIVQQFQLYPEMQEKYTREEILENMRDDIKLETISAEIAAQGEAPKSVRVRSGQEITIAFSISYRGKNPDTVQKVAGTLASSYLEQNLKIREAQAKTTTQFLEAESKELRERIQVIGAKITAFKKEHEGIQPELQGFNQAQAARLDQETKQIDNANQGCRRSPSLPGRPVGYGQAGILPLRESRLRTPRPVSGPCKSNWRTSNPSSPTTTRIFARPSGRWRNWKNLRAHKAAAPP